MIEGLPELMRPEVCTGCGICEQHCPDFAIEVKARRRKSEATDG
jgi:2-oxoglutarate ferredoxin oxidoreductase subunit delta